MSCKMIHKRETKVIRQAQIVNAARKLIVKYGSEHVTARRIAKEIGISEGAIYRHFKSKREILSLLLDNIEKSLIADLDKGKAGDFTPLQRLENALRSHVCSVEQRKGIPFLVMAEIISLGDKKLNKQVTGTITRYTDQIKVLIHDGVQAGEIRQDIDQDAAATLLFGMIQGLVNVWALSGYSFDLEQKYSAGWSVLRQGFVQLNSLSLAGQIAASNRQVSLD